MLQDPSDVGLGGLGEVEVVRGIEERVPVAFEQRLVCVHAAAVDARNRLGHERRVDPELLRDLFHGQSVGHDVVGHRECVGVAQVDLVLAGRDLVMDVLDRDPHRLEVLDGSLAVVGGDVQRRLVEVAALVEELGLLLGAEVEVLELWAYVEREAQVGGAL